MPIAGDAVPPGRTRAVASFRPLKIWLTWMFVAKNQEMLFQLKDNVAVRKFALGLRVCNVCGI